MRLARIFKNAEIPKNNHVVFCFRPHAPHVSGLSVPRPAIVTNIRVVSGIWLRFSFPLHAVLRCISTMSIGEAEKLLVEFLTECSEVEGASHRVHCHVCGASRSLYCPDCCRIVIPKEKWPKVIQGGSLRLPFLVDIILDDRRASSTGVQVATIMSESLMISPASPRVRLFEEDKGIPDYSNEQGTFLLFPGPSSVPMSSLAKTSAIKRLVFLDCKWTKTSSRMHPTIQNLQRVHLDHSFRQSYYWRWHTAGEGMISTVEAVYVSAWQVATEKGWDETERKKLLYLLWLFGLQREVIRRRYELDGGKTLPEHLPFSEDGKQYQRNLRIRKDNGANA